MPSISRRRSFAGLALNTVLVNMLVLSVLMHHYDDFTRLVDAIAARRDLIAADVHLEVEATLSVEAGHDIAVEARRRVMQAHPVLSLMIHVDPWRRPDRDHDTGPLSGR